MLVAVKAAAVNPGEIAIREGRLHERWPASFPSGEGTDLAGVVQALGDGVSEFALGNEVLGWSERRSSHAELVVVLAHLAGLVADGRLEIPIARTYPLARVRDAFEELAARHTHGKIVLLP